MLVRVDDVVLAAAVVRQRVGGAALRHVEADRLEALVLMCRPEKKSERKKKKGNMQGTVGRLALTTPHAALPVVT